MTPFRVVAYVAPFVLTTCTAWISLAGSRRDASIAAIDHRKSLNIGGGVVSPLGMVSYSIPPFSVSNDTNVGFASRRWQKDAMLWTADIPKEENRDQGASNYAAQRWNERFEQLRVYKEKYGHCHVPQPTYFGHNKYKALADWVRNQRAQYSSGLPYLTSERIEKLRSLGFEWNMHHANWQLRFHELVEFREQNGHTLVPSTYSENLALARWVSEQRRRYRLSKGKRSEGEVARPSHKPLTSEQIELLNVIGFCWTPKRDLWWKMYRELLEFRNKHGHCNVPQQYGANPHLGSWVRHQRFSCREYVHSVHHHGTTHNISVSGIDDERLKALREIEFCWLPDPSSTDIQPPEDIFEGY